MNDRALRDLLLAGRPNIELPSQFTISWDIKSSFEKCQQRIGRLLQVCGLPMSSMQQSETIV